jgi:oligoribonuclease (3'-5' exoribonuclease)
MSNRLVLVLLVALAVPVHADTPAWAAAIAEHFSAEPSPAAEPGRWLLAHVDVETTGLAPGWHEMIDAGVIITDLDGEELGRLFLRIMPAHPERLDPGAAAVNGFSVERWTSLGSVTEADAVARLRDFHARIAGDRPVLFTAYNSWFDIAFMDHLFRGQDATWRELWHYHVLDVPSMAWGLGHRDLFGGALSGTLGLEAETRDPLRHTGISGVEANVEKYRALLRRSHERSPSPSLPGSAPAGR